MKIIVCVKQINMPYAITGTDQDEFFISPEDRIFRINPYDEVAMEMALCIKERQETGKIIILTLGPLIAEKELRRCMAMGADDIYRIHAGAELDPWSIAVLLSKAIKQQNPDIVFCGRESLDQQNGQVGAFIAHILGMSFVSAVTDLIIKDSHAVETRRSAGRGIREVIECSLPAVITVDAGVHEPRVPAYVARQEALSMPIKRLTFTMEMSERKTLSAGLLAGPPPKNVPAPDNKLGAFDRIQQLLAGSRVEKKGVVLKGSPEYQVERIIFFLDEHGLLKWKKKHD